MINAIGITVVTTYLVLVVGSALSGKGDNSNVLFSVVGNLFRATVTKIDHSVQNYIEETDEEILEKVRQIKKDPTRKKVEPIKEETNKYEIFM